MPAASAVDAPGLTLYGSIRSRTFTARWLLAELGLPYRFVEVDLARGDQRDARYLRLNPMGKVPTLVDGDTVVTESTAICLYLADGDTTGRMAPTPGDPKSGAYLRWCVFATSTLEPALLVAVLGVRIDPHAAGWGDLQHALAAVEQALTPGPWVLGDAFSAADIVLGAQLSVAAFRGWFAPSERVRGYLARIEARPAYLRAAAETWPP